MVVTLPQHGPGHRLYPCLDWQRVVITGPSDHTGKPHVDGRLAHFFNGGTGVATIIAPGQFKRILPRAVGLAIFEDRPRYALRHIRLTHRTSPDRARLKRSEAEAAHR